MCFMGLVAQQVRAPALIRSEVEEFESLNLHQSILKRNAKNLEN